MESKALSIVLRSNNPRHKLLLSWIDKSCAMENGRLSGVTRRVESALLLYRAMQMGQVDVTLARGTPEGVADMLHEIGVRTGGGAYQPAQAATAQEKTVASAPVAAPNPVSQPEIKAGSTGTEGVVGVIDDDSPLAKIARERKW